jgi:hypothetical protein
MDLLDHALGDVAAFLHPAIQGRAIFFNNFFHMFR